MPTKRSLLEKVKTVKVGAIKSFVMHRGNCSHIIGDWRENGIVGRPSFHKNFHGKRERDVQAATIVLYDLKKDACVKDIFKALGQRVEIALAHIVALTERQNDYAKRGPLLTMGEGNLAFVKNLRGAVKPVEANYLFNPFLPDHGWWFETELMTDQHLSEGMTRVLAYE